MYVSTNNKILETLFLAQPRVQLERAWQGDSCYPLLEQLLTPGIEGVSLTGEGACGLRAACAAILTL